MMDKLISFEVHWTASVFSTKTTLITLEFLCELYEVSSWSLTCDIVVSVVVLVLPWHVEFSESTLVYLNCVLCCIFISYPQMWKKHDSGSVFLFLWKMFVGYTHTAPLYIDAFVGSQKVKAVEDSVAGDLDIIHWRKRRIQRHFSSFHFKTVKIEIPLYWNKTK